MKTYKLKSAFRRGSMLAAAVVVAGASLLPAVSSYADALNPLTDRSLTLSSSAPGWDFKDGSGNTTYADPNSGANGQKTGNTFDFKVSTDSSASGTDTAITAMTFQYCSAPAGTCYAPGNNATTSGVRGADSVSAKTSDLNITTATPTEVDNTGSAFFSTASGAVTAIPNKDNSEGNFLVMWKDKDSGVWTPSTGWTMTVDNDEDGQTPTGDIPADSTSKTDATGRNNLIILENATGVKPKATDEFKVIFFGTDTNYITNPGSGAFFVKINTYKTGYDNGQDGAADTANQGNLVDGGVTVANVMNLGISIQTKVLETMSFSVGTVDPYTLQTLPDDNGASPGGADTTSQLAIASGQTRTTHGSCDPILNSMNPGTDSANTLLLGSEENENSLSVDNTYSTHSYFRLSSNASAGASVYYSGVTLSNTVGDQIKPIGNGTVDLGAVGTAPSPGSEQFGLAFSNDNDPEDYTVNYKVERDSGFVFESGADNAAQGIVDGVADGWNTATGIDASVQTDWTAAGITGKLPMLRVYDGTGVGGDDDVSLTPELPYVSGAGVVNGGHYGSIDTKFAFDSNSNKIPALIATEDSKVVDCASGKIRYIANIAATTPAGIYTTKINYIAAPQY